MYKVTSIGMIVLGLVSSVCSQYGSPSSGSSSAIAPSTAASSSSSSPSNSSSVPILAEIFAPLNGYVVGVNGQGWVVDLALQASTPADNNLLSAAVGYSPLFNSPTNSTTFHVGANSAAPGLVVLLSTTPNTPPLSGPLTNLAGFFQINGVAMVNGDTLAQTWNTWLVLASLFGQNVNSTLTVYAVNGTAPTVVNPQTIQSGIISNIAQVNFTIT